MEYVRGDMTLIVVAGMCRTGSTWMFNAARLLYEHAGSKVWGGGTGAYYGCGRHSGADVAVVKEHQFLPGLAEEADFVLTSERFMVDVVLSYNRFKGEVPTLAETEKWMRNLKLWRSVTDYHMRYEELNRPDGPRYCLERIMAALTLNVSTLSVLRALGEQLRPPEEGKDGTTCVFANHYNSIDYETIRQRHAPL